MANNAGSTSKPPPIIFLTAFPLVKCFRKNGDILFTAIDMTMLLNKDLCKIVLIATNDLIFRLKVKCYFSSGLIYSLYMFIQSQ